MRRLAPRASGLMLGLLSATATLAQDTARMEQVIRTYTDSSQFMGSVLVSRGDSVLFEKSYGSANLEWDILNTPATKYRLGSLTKQFTAAAVLILEEQGKLKLEDPVRKHFPEAPPSWDGVTIFHVLTHSAGIPNLTATPAYAELKLLPTSSARRLQSLLDLALEFKPGERMSYTNTGYVLLGVLIERVSGKRYADFLQEAIFTPLDMRDSGYDRSAVVIPRRAAGYVPTPNGPINAPYIDMTVPYAAGSLYSTTGDLLKWERGLFGGKLISPASLKKMTTPFKGDYALGLLESHAGNRRALMHTGGIEGFNTYLAYYPDSQVTVAVLSNLSGSAPDEMGPKLGSLAHGDAVIMASERKAISVPDDVLQRYVGTYQLDANLNLVITREQSQLVMRLGPQPPIPIFPESRTRFFGRVVDAQIEFVEQGGAVTHLDLHMDGRELKAVRQ